MESANLVFYIFGSLAIVSALGVVLIPKPVHSALSLVITMISVSGIFWSLGAVFLAVVQLAIYAGAVMSLFVLVLMLFDLKKEKKAFSRGVIFGLFKVVTISLFLGVVGRVILLYSEFGLEPSTYFGESTDSTRELATVLFSKYVFGFEAISILLLIVVVGTVALSRSKGDERV